jgi:hypothetical protein
MTLKVGERFQTVREIVGTFSNVLAPVGAVGAVQKVYEDVLGDRYVVAFDGGFQGVNVGAAEIAPLDAA